MMRCPRLLQLCAVAMFVVLGGVGALRADSPKDRCVILISLDGLANFYLDDPKAEMPTLRRLIKEGAVADGMVSSFPTVTWPNHTTMVTGVPPSKHGVLGNSMMDRSQQEKVELILDPIFDKDEIVKVPTIYDVAHKAGLVTASIAWPCTRAAKTLDYTVPDMGRDAAWAKYGTTAWLAELKADKLPIDKYEEWFRHEGGEERDWLTTHMAEQLLEKHPPNLMLVHLLEVDHQEHRFGPRSAEAYKAIKLVDDQLASLLKKVEASKFKGKTTFVVISDHGFFPIQQQISPNVRLRQLGLIELNDKKAPKATPPVDATRDTTKEPAKKDDRIAKKSAWCMANGGSTALFVFDDANRAEIVSRLRDELSQIKGVDKVYGPEDFKLLGQPTREQDPRGGADLWLSAKSGYAFNDAITGDDLFTPATRTVGTHGYFADQPELLATCVLWGPDVKPGTKLGKVRMEDIAPTIAEVLDLKLPNVDGKSLLRK